MPQARPQRQRRILAFLPPAILFPLLTLPASADPADQAASPPTLSDVLAGAETSGENLAPEPRAVARSSFQRGEMRPVRSDSGSARSADAALAEASAEPLSLTALRAVLDGAAPDPDDGIGDPEVLPLPAPAPDAAPPSPAPVGAPSLSDLVSTALPAAPAEPARPSAFSLAPYLQGFATGSRFLRGSGSGRLGAYSDVWRYPASASLARFLQALGQMPRQTRLDGRSAGRLVPVSLDLLARRIGWARRGSATTPRRIRANGFSLHREHFAASRMSFEPFVPSDLTERRREILDDLRQVFTITR